MSITPFTYIGPYAECLIPTVKRQIQKGSACMNRDCVASGLLMSGNYCNQCGKELEPVIEEQEVPKVTAKQLQEDITDALEAEWIDERLILIPNHGSYMEDINNARNKQEETLKVAKALGFTMAADAPQQIGEDLPRLLLDRPCCFYPRDSSFHWDLEDMEIQVETTWFLQHFEEELSRLRQSLGGINVRVHWGVVNVLK